MKSTDIIHTALSAVRHQSHVTCHSESLSNCNHSVHLIFFPQVTRNRTILDSSSTHRCTHPSLDPIDKVWVRGAIEPIQEASSCRITDGRDDERKRMMGSLIWLRDNRTLTTESYVLCEVWRLIFAALPQWTQIGVFFLIYPYRRI